MGTMTVRDPFDLERGLVAYLKAHPKVTALVTGRVSTELPESFAGETRVQVVRIGGSQAEADDPIGYLDSAQVQILCYGPKKAQAWAVTAAVSAAVEELPYTAQTGPGVVTAVRRVLGPLWSPDPLTEWPRYLSGFTVWNHPGT